MSGGSLTVKQSAYQQAVGGSNPTSPLHNIKEIGHRTAKLFVEKWHYSKKMPTGKNINYGLHINNVLYAVIVWGIGVNPYQASFLNAQKVIEIKRMCRIEPKGNYQLTRFISITSKWVKKQFEYDVIVAFADPEHGHEGTVYKAAGFKLHGVTNPEWHLLSSDGSIRHRRYAYRYAKRKNIEIAQAREELGVKRIKTAPKYRWVRRHD